MLTVRALDNTFAGPFTSGPTRQTVDVAVNGGTTAIAASTAGIGTSVFPVGTGGNTPPSLSGVPLSANLNELTTLSFIATASDPDAGQTLTFSLAGAPVNATIDPDSGVFSWTPTEAQGPNTFVFEVRVTDGFAITAATVTVIVDEVNTAPVLASVPATAIIVQGEPLTFTATATDSDLIHGLHNSLTFSLVGGPAGGVVNPDTGVFSWTPDGSVTAGDYSFAVRVADDGVPSLSDSKPITVSVVASGQTGGDVFIAGTAGNDVIKIMPGADPSKIVAWLNGDPVGVFDRSTITGKIVVLGLAGSDRITVWPKLNLPTDLIGGSGNDTLSGGAGSDTLEGGTGNDRMMGGKGDDTYQFAESWGKDSVVETANAGADTLDFSTLTSGLSATWSGTLIVTDALNRVSASQVEELKGGAGIDTLTGVGTSVWDLTGTNSGTLKGRYGFDGFENLRGGAGKDTFVFSDGAAVTGSIAGEAGSNSLDYSAYSTAITVNLTLGTATNVAGGISQIAGAIGGAGDDLLVGDAGRNTLIGGAGRDVIIGDAGGDVLSGGAGDDLLLADQTNLDVDVAGLASVRAEWTSGSAYLDRVAHLTGVGGGLNAGVVLDGNSVHEDSSKDVITGGDGQDWFLSGAGDKLTDKANNEIQTIL
jgi:Ca2+-binding RTX toxin-like protein